MAVVSGVVSVGTDPVGSCSVQFHPINGGRPVATSTEEGAHYRIALEPGDYKVVVRPVFTPPAGWKEGDPVPPPPVEIPKVYTQPTTTNLQISIERPEDVTKDLKL